jgi:glutathione reductase (NADPH)
VLRRGFDPLITEVLNDELVRSGVALRTNSTEVAALKRSADGTIDATLGSGEVLSGFDCVMFAVGRHPATAALNLGCTGVTVDEAGRVRVDDFQWTGVDGIYCLGDAATTNIGFELTPVAIAAGSPRITTEAGTAVRVNGIMRALRRQRRDRRMG